MPGTTPAWVLDEDDALELLAFLVTAARTQVDEAAEYGPMRLLAAAHRLRAPPCATGAPGPAPPSAPGGRRSPPPPSPRPWSRCRRSPCRGATATVAPRTSRASTTCA